MKLKFDIECSADEARAFFGLPDVKAMQEDLVKEIQARLKTNMQALDPEALLKTWMPAGLKGFEQLQEMFLNMGTSGRGKK